MLDLAVLREALGWSVDREADIERTANSLVSRLETETNRLWHRRVNYVYTTRMRWTSREVGLILWPVETLTKVESRCINDTDWTELELDTDFKLIGDSRGVARVLYAINSEWDPEVRITLTGGYAEASDDPSVAITPDEVVSVLIAQARFDDQRGSADRIAVSSLAVAGGQTTFMNSKAHPMFEAFCRTHRRHF